MVREGNGSQPLSVPPIFLDTFVPGGVDQSNPFYPNPLGDSTTFIFGPGDNVGSPVSASYLGQVSLVAPNGSGGYSAVFTVEFGWSWQGRRLHDNTSHGFASVEFPAEKYRATALITFLCSLATTCKGTDGAPRHVPGSSGQEGLIATSSLIWLQFAPAYPGCWR